MHLRATHKLKVRVPFGRLSAMALSKSGLILLSKNSLFFGRQFREWSISQLSMILGFEIAGLDIGKVRFVLVVEAVEAVEVDLQNLRRHKNDSPDVGGLEAGAEADLPPETI